MPPRLPRPTSRDAYVCRTCLLARQGVSNRHSVRFSTHSSGLRAQHKTEDLDDFYALLLSEPLPTPARTTRQPSQPPPSTPTDAQPLSTARPPSQATTASDPNSSTSQTSDAAAPPSTTSSSPSTAKSPEQLDVAARARLVFGSRHLGPEERSQRAAERKAASTMIGGIRVPPRPSEPDNCCMSGCVNCVWDLYREELEEWAAARQDAEKALFQRRAGDGVASSSSTPVSGGGGGTGGGVVRDGRAADLRSQQQVTGGAMAEGAISMDDDGGGSSSNWDAEDALLPGSGSKLFESVPMGIREFMRTEKRLGRRRREREEGASA